LPQGGEEEGEGAAFLLFEIHREKGRGLPRKGKSHIHCLTQGERELADKKKGKRSDYLNFFCCLGRGRGGKKVMLGGTARPLWRTEGKEITGLCIQRKQRILKPGVRGKKKKKKKKRSGRIPFCHGEKRRKRGKKEKGLHNRRWRGGGEESQLYFLHS